MTHRFATGSQSVLLGMTTTLHRLEKLRIVRGVFVDGLRAGEGLSDVGADVFAAYVLFEASLGHEAGGLLACSAENKGAAGGVDFVGEALKGLEAGGVDGCHVAETQNEYLGK